LRILRGANRNHPVLPVGPRPVLHTQVLYPMAQKAMGTGMYCPSRQSMLCRQKHCSFWKQCEKEFGGRIQDGTEFFS
jgi:hypothetical protein